MPDLMHSSRPPVPQGDDRGLRQSPTHPLARTDRTRLPAIAIDDGETPDVDVLDVVAPTWRETTRTGGAGQPGDLCDVSEQVVILARRTLPWGGD